WVIVEFDAERERVDEQLRHVCGDSRDDSGDHRHCEQAGGDRRAGIPDQSNDPGKRGRGAPDGLLEVAPAPAKVLRPFWLLGLLDDRVAREAAVGWTAVRNLGPPTAPHPE